MRKVIFETGSGQTGQTPPTETARMPRQVILGAKSAENRAVQKEGMGMKAPTESGPKPPTKQEQIEKAEKGLQAALDQLEDIKKQKEIRDRIGGTSAADSRLQERESELNGNIRILKTQLETLRKGPMLTDEGPSPFPHKGEYFG